MKQGLWIVGISVLLAACGSESSDSDGEAFDAATVSLSPDAQTGRWYSEAQVEQGREVFGQFCASCHGKAAEATEDWKVADANGNYPPPPLNGSAHAWHHPLAVLDQVIRDGTADMGGSMPAWGRVIDAEQRLAVIAGFQAYWSDEIYDIWLKREVSSRGD